MRRLVSMLRIGATMLVLALVALSVVPRSLVGQGIGSLGGGGFNAATDLLNLDAGNLTSGQVAVARLADFLAADNVFSAKQSFTNTASGDGSICNKQDVGIGNGTAGFGYWTLGGTGIAVCDGTDWLFRMHQSGDRVVEVHYRFLVHSAVNFNASVYPQAMNTNENIGSFGSGASYFLPVPFGIGDFDSSTPTCDSAHRGVVAVDKQGSGSADELILCTKDADDNYSWKSIPLS